MATQILSTKNTAEELTIEFDMLSRLKVGETVATATVTCGVYSGTDPSPSAMIVGLAVVSGSIVKQKVIGGLVGNVYLLTCTARTSLNDLVINQGKLVVLTPEAA